MQPCNCFCYSDMADWLNRAGSSAMQIIVLYSKGGKRLILIKEKNVLSFTAHRNKSKTSDRPRQDGKDKHVVYIKSTSHLQPISTLSNSLSLAHPGLFYLIFLEQRVKITAPSSKPSSSQKKDVEKSVKTFFFTRSSTANVNIYRAEAELM